MVCVLNCPVISRLMDNISLNVLMSLWSQGVDLSFVVSEFTDSALLSLNSLQTHYSGPVSVKRDYDKHRSVPNSFFIRSPRTLAVTKMDPIAPHPSK